MPNTAHLNILKHGVETWNKWRSENAEIIPDLSGADLSGANLCKADFSGADLSGANLTNTNLSGANLSGGNLASANLSAANLGGANLSKANLSGVDTGKAELRGMNLSDANLSGVDIIGMMNLIGTDFSGADLSGANLCGANLRRADLSGANLGGANLGGADLGGADLSNADLSWVALSGVNLSGADLSGSGTFAANLKNSVKTIEEDRAIETMRLEATLVYSKSLAEFNRALSSANELVRAHKLNPKLDIEAASLTMDSLTEITDRVIRNRGLIDKIEIDHKLKPFAHPADWEENYHQVLEVRAARALANSDNKAAKSGCMSACIIIAIITFAIIIVS